MRRQVGQFFLLLVVYLLFAIPFKGMALIPGFTDVRPVMALGPIYGVFYGPVGCLASAFGNLAADIADNALHWSSLAGFAANFLGPCIVWYAWRRIARRPFALRTLRDLGFHSVVVTVAALLETIMIVPSVAIAHPEVNLRFFAGAVFGNTALFPIVLGIPLAILMQEELGFRPACETNQSTRG